MIFKPEHKICLWEPRNDWLEGKITILREVIVTIMEVKPGDTSVQALRGHDENFQMYDKHWRKWPDDSIKKHLNYSWSEKFDSNGLNGLWTPNEAVAVYNRAPKDRMKIVDLQGNPMVPKGDVNYCIVHNEYYHEGDECSKCFIVKPRLKQPKV